MQIQHLPNDSSNMDSTHSSIYAVQNQNIRIATLCWVGIGSLLHMNIEIISREFIVRNANSLQQLSHELHVEYALRKYENLKGM